MNLTPLEAEKERFRTAFRGYARDDVERFRAQMITALEEHIAVESQLKARIIDLESRLERYREMENLVKDSVVLAQRTCDELIAAAHAQADNIKHEARQEGSRIRGELSELRSQREQFEYAFYGLLTGFQHRLVQGNPSLAAPAGAPPVELSSGQPVKTAVPPRRAVTTPSPPVEPPETMRAGSSAPPPSTAVSPAADSPGQDSGPPEPRSREQFTRIPQVRPTQAPAVPGIPVPRGPAAAPRSTGGGEIDRDADIADFSAVLAEAGPDPQAPWPGHGAAEPSTDEDAWPSLQRGEQPIEPDSDQPE